jgi:hypothetical protein
VSLARNLTPGERLAHHSRDSCQFRETKAGSGCVVECRVYGTSSTNFSFVQKALCNHCVLFVSN